MSQQLATQQTHLPATCVLMTHNLKVRQPSAASIPEAESGESPDEISVSEKLNYGCLTASVTGWL